jgi:peptide/nickel transport system substrate-binding protein
MMRRGLILMAALALAACGRSGPKGASLSDPPPRFGSDAAVSYPRSDYVAGPAGRRGGTLRVAAARDNGTLDAQILADTNTKWLGRLTTDCLVYLDDKGGITPWLAKSWEISPDGRTYTFHLRDGVSFSDGTPLDAEAVRVNFARIHDPKTHAAMTTAYISPYVSGEVRERLTFVAHLSAPYAPFLNVLAQAWFGLLSPRQIEQHSETIATAPIGSGPFVVTSYVRQQGVTLKRRAGYDWAPPFTGKRGPALLDGIDIRIIPEPLARYAALASGEVDMIMDAPPQNIAALRADPAFVVRNRINLGNPVRGITFNVERSPFDDVRVRRAFALSLDRDAIAKLIGFGEFAPTANFLSASTPYRDAAAGRLLAPDMAAANHLLDAAGWTARGPDGIRTKNGKRLEAQVLSTDSNQLGQTVVAIQAQVRHIGFDLQIAPITVAQFATRRKAGDYQATGAGYWHTNTPDGLFIVYHGDQITNDRVTGQNISRLRDPQLDDLLSRARRGGDPSMLAGLYARAQLRLAGLVPAVPLFENHTLVAYRRGVTGVIFDTSHNTPHFDTISLDGGGA